MMNFLPQGYNFESYSNPYQSQFVSPYYGSGQYGWQYSPMAQYGPRLPTVQPGTAPPWLPPGMVATPSSGVQELSVLFDPTLAARMATAYNPWTVAYWGKPDIPAWLWPDGASPQPVPPNVCCTLPPCVGPGPPGGGGGGLPGPGIDTPDGGPVLTPGPTPVPTPQPRPTPTPGPQWTPGPSPAPPGLGGAPGSKSTQPNPRSPLRRGMFNSRWASARAPERIVFSTMPLPGQPSVIAANHESLRARATAPRSNPGPNCYQRPDQASCTKCCSDNAKTQGDYQKCINQCIALPPPKPKGRQPGTGLRLRRSPMSRSNTRRLSRIRSSARRRGVPALPIGVGPMMPRKDWRCYNGVCRGTDVDNLKTGDCVYGTMNGVPTCCCSTVIV